MAKKLGCKQYEVLQYLSTTDEADDAFFYADERRVLHRMNTLGYVRKGAFGAWSITSEGSKIYKANVPGMLKQK